MKKWRSILAVMLVIVLVFAFAACGSDSTPESSDPVESSEPETESSDPGEEDPDDSGEEESLIVDDTTVVMGTDIGALPRNETVYYSGLQWNTPVNNNPFSTGSNNPLVITQEHLARVLVYETLYMFNQMDGKAYPLLADGDYVWNADRTVLTVKINQDATWNDGTPVTANDVVATFDAHVQVSSSMGTDYGQYIDRMEAADDYTVEIYAKSDNYNPMKVLEYIPRAYVLQKAYLDTKLAEYGDDTEGFKNDTWFDAPYSGSYHPVFMSAQKVVLERDDNYWGQAASMWGKLAEPKYIAHNIYKNNDAGAAALRVGEVDISQQFMQGVPDMWNVEGLPISTYYDEPLCYQSAQMPSIWFNTTKPGLDQKAIRQAIAYAIDYDQINQSAMSGYSPSFEDAPRSLMVPLPGEEKWVDRTQLEEYQWGSRDYDKANALLDDAGIVDTDGDGIREYDGENLVFTAQCPDGWNDWQASLEIVAAAGEKIGISISTNYTTAPVWMENLQTGSFDIIMTGTNAATISAPWGRAYQAFYVTDPAAERVYWGWHRMQNDEINAMIDQAAVETDEATLIQIYTDISKYMLDEMPLVALMYRPSLFHTVSEVVWTGWQEDGDGTNIPPTLVSDGYGYAALYNLTNVN